MTKVSPANPSAAGKVEEVPWGEATAGNPVGTPCPSNVSENDMTATSATAVRVKARTGGPQDDGPKLLEHLAGWTLVVVLAMLVTQAGLL